MKPNNPDNTKLVERCFRWSHLLAIAGLAVGITSYVRMENRISSAEYNSQLMANLTEMTQCSVLLREINTGETNQAAAFLKSKLASDLDIVNRLKQTGDAPEDDFAKIVLNNVARDEKAHPEYYLLASARLPKTTGSKVAQTTRH